MNDSTHLGKKDSTRQELRAAVHNAMLYLEEHYDSIPCTKILAKHVGLSTYHFHRAFRSIVGETVAKYHKRIRIERAAVFLKHSNWQIAEIGLTCGFETHASFARAFKSLYGKSPYDFRNEEGAIPYLRGYLRSHQNRIIPSPKFVPPTVVLEDWPSLKLITLRFIGSVNDILKPWSELLKWAKINIPNLENARFFGLWFDNWSDLDQTRYRYECCILTSHPISRLPSPFTWRTIPASQVATTLAHGSVDEIDRTWRTFSEGWLPFSGNQPRGDFAIDEYASVFLLATYPKKILLSALGQISVKLCLPLQDYPLVL